MEKLLLSCQKRTIGAYGLLSGLLLYLGINEEAMIIYFVFLVFDTLTGFIKAWVVTKDPTSKRLGLGIVVKLLYLCVPLVVAGAMKGVGLEEVSGITTSLILSLFILNESYSIIQNIYSIKMGKNVLEYDASKAIMNFILKRIKSSIDEKIE